MISDENFKELLSDYESGYYDNEDDTFGYEDAFVFTVSTGDYLSGYDDFALDEDDES